MGKCLFLRKGETHTAPISGILANTLAVGSTVKLMENGVAAEYLVVHQGLPSSMYDASCDGTWLLRKNTCGINYWNSNGINSYESSTIHSYLNSDFFNSFGSIEQSVIKQVKIPYRAGAGTGTSITSGENGLSTKVFFLSATEVSFNFGSDLMPTDEGAELSYFAGCADNNSDSKRIEPSSNRWWLRTPYCNSSASYRYALFVDSTGNWNSGLTTEKLSILPAIILPSTALFDKTTLLLKGVA